MVQSYSYRCTANFSVFAASHAGFALQSLCRSVELRAIGFKTKVFRTKPNGARYSCSPVSVPLIVKVIMQCSRLKNTKKGKYLDLQNWIDLGGNGARVHSYPLVVRPAKN